MNIAYTIGAERSYDEYLLSSCIHTKLGKRDDYPGGWAWA